MPHEEAPLPVAAPGPIAEGDRVYVKRLNAEAVVLEVGEAEAKVQAGSMRLSVPVEELLRLPPRPAAQQPRVPAGKSFGTPSEINLRGLTVEEALERLDKFLDDAFMAGYPEVRVIHGKGTGAVRRAVHEALGKHPLVGEFRVAEPSAGGVGATLVRMEH